jgi:hypothetical protein
MYMQLLRTRLARKTIQYRLTCTAKLTYVSNNGLVRNVRTPSVALVVGHVVRARSRCRQAMLIQKRAGAGEGCLSTQVKRHRRLSPFGTKMTHMLMSTPRGDDSYYDLSGGSKAHVPSFRFLMLLPHCNKKA